MITGWADVKDLCAFLLAEPILIEIPLLLLLAAVLWGRHRQLARRARAIDGHEALDDLLLGYEALLARDAPTALRRLTRACAIAPQDRAALSALATARQLLSGSADEVPTEPSASDSVALPDGDDALDADSFARFLATSPELGRRIDAPRRVVDALEVNRQHLHRLLDSALLHDEPAIAELREIGTMAAGEVLRRAVAVADARLPLIELCVSLGDDLLPALLAALREPGDAPRSEPDRHAAARFVIEVAVRSPTRAAAVINDAVQSLEPALRDVGIDMALAVDPAIPLDSIIQGLSRAELIRALDRVDTPRLARLLRSLPRDHTLLQIALGKGTPAVLHAVLAALPGARATDVLRARVLERDAIAVLGEELVDRAVHGEALAIELVAAAGPSLADLLALCLTDLARPPTEREQAGALLRDLGSASVRAVAATLGSTATPIDDAVLAHWIGLGATAVIPLRDLLQEFVAAAQPQPVEHTACLAAEALARVDTAGSRRVLEALRRQTRLPRAAALAARLLQTRRDAS